MAELGTVVLFKLLVSSCCWCRSRTCRGDRNESWAGCDRSPMELRALAKAWESSLRTSSRCWSRRRSSSSCSCWRMSAGCVAARCHWPLEAVPKRVKRGRNRLLPNRLLALSCFAKGFSEKCCCCCWVEAAGAAADPEEDFLSFLLRLLREVLCQTYI